MASASIRAADIALGESPRSLSSIADAQRSMEEMKNKRLEALERQKNKASAEEQIKLEAKINKERERLDRKSAQNISKLKKELQKKEIEEYEKLFGKSFKSIVSDAAKKIAGAFNDSVEKYIDTYVNYMSKINTRLQGAGLTYESMNNVISRNTAANPYITYTKTLEKLNNLVEAGIADNVVQRAFLDTIAEKIATTFNAAEGSLLEIIRIQQRDSTAARLGMEAELTSLFNHYFSDTSYLGSTYDSVQAALIDLSSQVSDKEAVEIEYIIQKWLGSLGSVGVSSSTLTSIAQGLNYLGTGNISGLGGNQAIQNLLIMAASRGGLNFSSLLTGGINANEANALLTGLIQYVQGIAGSGNRVVKQQYAQLFGLSMSDLAAFQNLSSSTLSSLAANGMTYSDTLRELNSQLGQVGSRMHLSEMIQNVIDNTLAATGMGVANNPFAYGLWKGADMLESITGGIELPAIGVLGNFVDLNMSLEGLVKSGVVGFSAMNSILNGIANVFLNNGGLGTFGSNGQNTIWGMSSNKGAFSGYQNLGSMAAVRSTTNYVSSGSDLGIQQALTDEQIKKGEQITGSEEEDDDSPNVILKFIRDYLRDGGSNANPLKVTLYEEGMPFNFYNRLNRYS